MMVLPRWRDRSGESEKRGERDIEKLVVGLLGPWSDRGQQTWVPSVKRLILTAAGAPSPAPPPQVTVEFSPRACRSHPSGSRGQGLPVVSDGTSRQKEQESRRLLPL